jgi:predicted DCC family thiol-disulfide oxidoreductase YuxK
MTQAPSQKKSQVTVYFDGLCYLCAWEIEIYRKSEGHERLEMVDITSEGFQAENHGLDPYEVHRSFHVRDPEGKLHSGVPAFIEIWKVLPKFQWLAKVAPLPPVMGLLRLGYFGFSRVRPYLPRKKGSKDCSASPYCELPGGNTR